MSTADVDAAVAGLPRRQVLAGTGLALAGTLVADPLAAFAAPAPVPGSAATRRRPNIVLVVADDLGWNELGCYGSPVIQTPSIDRMAQEGIRFTDFYAGAPVCAPSRCGMLTGMNAGHSRVRQNPQPGSGDTPLQPEDTTIAQVLRAAGYRTGLFGKWGFCPDVGHHFSHPNSKGFDEFFGPLTHLHAHDYYSDYQWHNSERVTITGNTDGARHTYLPDLRASRALDFISRHRDVPFFLMLADTQPHAPQDVPAIDPAYANNPALGDQARRHCTQVSNLDRQVGQIVAKLTELGLVDDTVVIFTSDNGPHEEGGVNPDAYDANGALRGYKRNLYDGGIRVPLVAWSPYLLRHRAGVVSSHAWAGWDLMPTLASLAGAPTPSDVDGLPMDAALTGGPTGSAAPPQHDTLYFYRLDPYRTTRQNNADGGRGLKLAEAARRGRWKAVRFSPDRTRNHPDSDWDFELYDLAADPGETTDVAASNPQVAAQLLADMKSGWYQGEYPRQAREPESLSVHAPWYIGPGSRGPVTLKVVNNSGAVMTGVTLGVEVPTAWFAAATGPTTATSLAPGAAFEAQWTVTVPQSAAPHTGRNVTGTATWQGGGGAGSRQITTTVQVPPAPPATTAYLSDLAWMSAVSGWGPVERDLSNGERAAGDGRPLRIAGATYAKGLGCHAPSDIWYYLGGATRRFTATVGVDDEVGNRGSVRFQVWGDGRALFDSGRITGGSAGRAVDVDTTGVRVLALVVTTAGDGNGHDHSNWAQARVVRDNTIPRGGWSVRYVDSQETVGVNRPAVNAFDGDPGTIWHTKWFNGSDPLPHEIQIDLGAGYDVSGLCYLPRQDGNANGRIGQYEIYVSTDGVNWGSAVATGTFANTAHEKEILFTAKTGRYLRLRALSEVNGNPWTSAAEINALA